MKLTYNFQKDLIGFLVGFLMLSLLYFRIGWFFRYNYAVALSFYVFVFFGFLLTTFFSFRLIRLPGFWGISLLILFEVSIHFSVVLSIKNQKRSLLPIPEKAVFYASMANIVQYDSALSEFNDRYGYLYKSSTNSVFNQWEFGDTNIHSNSAGLRDDDESSQHPEIICLGDSFTTGWGVDQQETFAQILERETSMKVLNAGISSFGTVRETLLLEKFVSDSCKWVVIQYCMNDFQENTAWLTGYKTYDPRFHKEGYKLRVTQNQVFSSYSPFRYTYEYLKQLLILAFKLKTDERVFGNDQNMEEQVSTFYTHLQSIRKFYNGNIIVISQSNSSTRLDPLFINTCRELSEKDNAEKVYFVDTNSMLRSDDNYYFDEHLKPSGHRKVADVLTDFIRSY
ncbi:MAG: hypothetical protein ACI9V1_003337 [Spirosomataceae bacterium]|jgi:hypothetical protein